MDRSLMIFLHDLLMAVLAWIGAYWLRSNLEAPPDFRAAMVNTLAIVAAVQGIVFYAFGLYRGVWRFASVSDLKRILLAVGVAALATPTMLTMAQQHAPRSVYILDPLLLVMLMGGVRFTYRAWKDGHFFLRRTGVGTPVLIVGVGESAMGLIKTLATNQTWRVVGFVHTRANQAGRQIGGVPILGGLDHIAQHAERAEARHVIIAMPSAAERRRATEAAAAAGLAVMTVPSLDDLLSGRVAVSSIRKVELEDLLGRDRIDLDEAGLLDLLKQKTVLVTGAGGSIGSELCRQVARFRPRRLVFVEQSEFALYAVEQMFLGAGFAGEAICRIGDVKDAGRMQALCAEYRPDVVFHAAAYKHVPLMENDNAWDAVCNNVQGALNIARAAIASRAREFVLISTDKAVNPTNVMGASKRLAEMVCQALQAEHRHACNSESTRSTRFVIVRFGNVLGSSGSVIPRFREQIAQGGPVTVTHPDIIRYFMLIPEAVQLVLQAGLMASRQGEGGEIFVLDMGEPVKIVDLARDLIRLSGFTEDEIKIEYTGLRPGEKLYEELLADGEATLPTPHPKLRIAKPTPPPDTAWLAELEAWLATPMRGEAEVKQGIKARVAEYRTTGG